MGSKDRKDSTGYVWGGRAFGQREPREQWLRGVSDEQACCHQGPEEKSWTRSEDVLGGI